MLKALRIPPGLKRAGTEYQSKGFWFDANMVRWYENTMRPIGGWTAVALNSGSQAQVSGVPRGMHAWRSNEGDAYLIIGTTTGVWAYKDGILTDITDTGGTIPPLPTPPDARAYGSEEYGSDRYGRRTAAPPPTGQPGVPLVVNDDATWVFDNFGQLPVGVLSSDKILRSWDLNTANNMVPVSALAPECVAVVVTAERHVMALGASTRASTALVSAPTAAPGADSTVTIGSITYTFKTTVGAAYTVKRGANDAEALENLKKAINQEAGAGTNYGTGTAAHTGVYASITDTNVMTIVARETGLAGNGIAVSTNVTGWEWTFDETTGGSGSPTGVQWSDRESLTSWIASELNTAGSYVLSSSGKILNGKRTPRETLIWTDTDLHSAVFVGGDAVYRFEWRGDKCGAIGPNAMTTVGDVAYWMGDNGFFRYDGAVSGIPCDVHDYVFSRLNKPQGKRVYAVSVSQFSEVFWFYVSTSSSNGDIDSYVSFNWRENHWSHGTLKRTAGVDRGVYTLPIMADRGGLLWTHESGTARPGADPIYCESGPVEIEDGNNVWMVRRLVPDERNLGDVRAYIAPAFQDRKSVV